MARYSGEENQLFNFYAENVSILAGFLNFTLQAI